MRKAVKFTKAIRSFETEIVSENANNKTKCCYVVLSFERASSDVKRCRACRSRNMLENESSLAKSASIQLRTSPPNSYFDMCSSPNCRVQISYVGVLTCRPGERNQVAVLRFESGSVHLRKKMPALAEWPLTQP